MDNIIHTNYDIQTENGKTVIRYKRTRSDWVNLIYYAIIGTTGTFFPAYLFYSSKHFDLTANSIITICFFSLWFLWGLINLVAALELLFLPTKSIITIDKYEKTFKAKLSFFRTLSLPFEDINLVQLSGNEVTYSNYYLTRTVSRSYRYNQLQLLLTNGKTKRIHRFSSYQVFSKLKKEQGNISKHVARLIADEIGKKYVWLGRKKDKADT